MLKMGEPQRKVFFLKIVSKIEDTSLKMKNFFTLRKMFAYVVSSNAI